MIMKPPLIKPCRICGEPVTPVRLKSDKGFRYPFQCTNCFNKPRDPVALSKRLSALHAGMNHPLALPLFTERIIHEKYVTIKVAPSGRWPLKHRWVMEQHLGRKLEDHEMVHHINEDTFDNDISNLRLMSKSCHIQLHKISEKWSANYPQCIECGTIEIPHCGKGLCQKCYSQKTYIPVPLKWSYKHDSCVKCGTKDSKHQGHGLCHNCYLRQYRRKNRQGLLVTA